MWLDANGKRLPPIPLLTERFAEERANSRNILVLTSVGLVAKLQTQLEYSMRPPFATDRFPRCLVAIIPPQEAWNGGVRSWIMNPLKTQEP
jgi:hypothetical protein